MSSIPHQRKKRFYKRRLFWAILVLILLVAGGSAYAIQSSAPKTSDYDYLTDTVSVERQTVKKTVTTTGVIVPDYTDAIVVPTGGTITELPHGVGDDVDRDELLLKTSTGVVVNAPFSGRITSLNGVIDGQISPTSAVMNFSYRSNHIEFFASENEVIDLQKGQKVRFTIPSYNNGRDEFTGEVSFVDIEKQSGGISVTGQAQDSGYKVKVTMNDLPETLSKVLGLTVDMTIDVATKENVAAISTSAIQYDDAGQAFIYEPPVVDEAFVQKAAKTSDVSTLLKRTNIQTGLRGDVNVEILDGLNVGEEALIYVPKTSTGSFVF